MHTISNGPKCQATAGIWTPFIKAVLIGPIRFLYARCNLWYARARERRSLARLDSRLLRDIGVNRMDAAREAAKPFWKA
ncbi:MAG: DUF1127 domain-containing protein [Alphaproteobacteria bacterium]